MGSIFTRNAVASALITTLMRARFLRFALVGGTGFLIDAALLAILHHGAGFDPFSARVLSISASAFSTWRLNRRITFEPSGRHQASEGLRYGVVAALTAGVNYLLYALALVLWPALPPIAALIGATLLAMGLSYAGYSRLVFQRARAVFASPSSHRR
jgi:putative flippase GtrA